MYPYFLFPATARTLNYDLNDHDHHRHGHYGMPELPGSYDAGKQRVNTYENSNEEHRNIGINNEGVSSSSSSSASSFSSSSSSSSSFSNRPKHDYEPDHQRSREHDLDRHEINLNNQHNNDYNLHHRHRERHRHDKHPDAPAPALPPPPPPSLPDTIVNEFDPAQSPPMLQPGTNVFAPRPNYKHGAVVVDRIDDDFGLPVDRLYDLREAFEGFVAQGSYFIYGHLAKRFFAFLQVPINISEQSDALDMLTSTSNLD